MCVGVVVSVDGEDLGDNDWVGILVHSRRGDCRGGGVVREGNRG